MENKRNRKGFTLAELLIVVAIIAVLVAIAIPVFTAQLEKSREATDAANIRSAYAECMTAYLTNGSETSTTVTKKQTKDGWEDGMEEIAGVAVASIDGGGSGSVVVGIDASGNVTLGDATVAAQ